MRRFSQRSALVTLSEINITPLLDLAFVLLIIFVITTVAGLLVAIPSMFAYNWLVHNLRVLTVELDNFAMELASRIESEYLED